MIEIFDTEFDDVIKSYFIDLKVDYKFALENFFPRINKLDFQRNPLNKKFYERLEKDIIAGCVMPPITIAIKHNVKDRKTNDEWKNYIIDNMDKAFVLDGIQRLSTLKRVSNNEGFIETRPLYVNILVCDSMNKLLYRMITLNNGQKSMSARHQIEILTDTLIDYDDLNIQIITEKEKSKREKDKISFDKEIIIKSYLAFTSGSVNIDNQKIIADRMDSLLTDKIIQSNLDSRETEFYDVLKFISNQMNQSEVLHKWFDVANNLIGFSAASSTNFQSYSDVSSVDLEESVDLLESAFRDIDVSKIQLGRARRRMVDYFFRKYETLSKMSASELLDRISQEI